MLNPYSRGIQVFFTLRKHLFSILNVTLLLSETERHIQEFPIKNLKAFPFPFLCCILVEEDGNSKRLGNGIAIFSATTYSDNSCFSTSVVKTWIMEGTESSPWTHLSPYALETFSYS
ncbi:hypothetical protein MKW92_049797 [Papaver armeniacum]|nr:hypothetical protein MKW92_049797 [Papaver armeniacum]